VTVIVQGDIRFAICSPPMTLTFDLFSSNCTANYSWCT